MPLLPLILVCAVILGVAYRVYGTVLARLMKLDPNVVTPAVELKDGVDYDPIEPKFLLGQHFSAIAAAGPIVGPIVAGLLFGWLPALLWILIGSILIGGVHDFTALVASVRHKARSIAEVVRDHMTRQSYLLFLAFIWIALVYIIVAFTDVTAQSFIGPASAANGGVSGGAIATSSLLYLALPLIMGVLLRYTKLSLGAATAIFIPLVLAAIWVGPRMPFDLAATLGISGQQAHKVWDVSLLVYCFIASVVPVWLLLQPRGHLGGYFLYAALAVAAIGLMFGNKTAQYPAFTGWVVKDASGATQMLFPILFITIACGACSGFHSIVASGTTSKQLKRETDARPIGYGTMLLEAMVAIIALSCVMMLPKGDPALSAPPNQIYANGIGSFATVFGIPRDFAIAFGLMAFATFVYDTLDICTRLGRFIVQELTGWKDRMGQVVATALTAGVPIFFVLQTATDAKGAAVPIWKVFWSLFGASNQLLAALTLLGVTVWLLRSGRTWAWWVTGLPTLWMYGVSVWALGIMTWDGFTKGGSLPIVPWVGVVLITLAGLMLIEAVRVLSRPQLPPVKPQPVPAGA